MKRAPVVLAATAAGLAATLGFNALAQTAATSSAVTTTTTSSSATASSSPKSTSSKSAASSSASKSTSKTVLGDAIDTRYGPVQLRVTVANGRIVNIQPVELPSQDPKSVEINQYAAPLLRQSALSKQSANIDVVSGATYTSEGYKAALQSALDKTGFPTTTSSASA